MKLSKLSIVAFILIFARKMFAHIQNWLGQKKMGDKWPKIIVLLLVIVALISFVFYVVADRPRAFQISAQTEYLELKTNSSYLNRWLLHDMQVCEVSEEDMFFGSSSEQALDQGRQGIESCSKREQKIYQEVYISPQENLNLTVTWSSQYGLQIHIKHNGGFHLMLDGQKVSVNQPVVLSQGVEVESEQVTIPFEGILVLGQSWGAGSQYMLREGTVYAYENTLFKGRFTTWLEKHLGMSFEWDERYQLNEQPLFMGDVVRFFDQKGSDATVKGIMRVQVNDDGNRRGMVTFVSAVAKDNSGLLSGNSINVRTDRLGTEGFVFSPSIWARVQNAPDITIVLMVFGALMVFFEVISKVNFSKDASVGNKNE